MASKLVYAVWAFAAGAGIPLMATLSGGLARHVGGARPATVVLFAAGLVAAIAVLLAAQPLPSVRKLGSGEAHQYLGGLFVVFYILSVTALIPRFGLANTVLCVLLAQLITSATLEATGVLGVATQPLSPLRVLGLILVAAGVCVAQFAAASAARSS